MKHVKFTQGLAAVAAEMLNKGIAPSKVIAELGVHRNVIYKFAAGETFTAISGGPIDWKSNRPVLASGIERQHGGFVVETGRAEWLTNLATSLMRLRRRPKDVTAEKRLAKSVNGVFLPMDAAALMGMPVDAWLHFMRHGRMAAGDQDRLIVIGDELLVCGGNARRYDPLGAAEVAVAQSAWV